MRYNGRWHYPAIRVRNNAAAEGKPDRGSGSGLPFHAA